MVMVMVMVITIIILFGVLLDIIQDGLMVPLIIDIEDTILSEIPITVTGTEITMHSQALEEVIRAL